jgi:hypothetical protein
MDDGRLHGAWTRAAGDGLYRALVRWGAGNIEGVGDVPFAFGTRVRLNGGDFAGVYLDVFQTVGGVRQLRLFEYVGSGATATLLHQVAAEWTWDAWHWVEVEVTGATVRARLYSEAEVASGWQVAARTAATGPGATGPGMLGGSAIDLRRLEYYPPAAIVPEAAQDDDWALVQITEQA